MSYLFQGFNDTLGINNKGNTNFKKEETYIARFHLQKMKWKPKRQDYLKYHEKEGNNRRGNKTRQEGTRSTGNAGKVLPISNHRKYQNF